MSRSSPASVIVLVAVASLVSCRTSRIPAPSEIYELGSAFTKLSRAVEVAVRYGATPATLEDEALIDSATQDDPGLKAPFRGYRIRARRDQGHAVLLLCSRDGRIGLLEDAGCSAKLDAHLWQTNPEQPCEFTLDVAVACPSAPSK